MSEEGFLRAIADEPGEDALRQIYADWLEDRADPRAELIRLEHALGPGPMVDPRRLDLADRLEGRGHRDMADFLRRVDPQRRALEARRRRLLAGVGVGWLAVVSRRGPCLHALATREQVVLELVSRGCFHSSSWAFAFSGGRPPRVKVVKPAAPVDRMATLSGTVRLTRGEVDRLDALLEYYRATPEQGGSSTSILFHLAWYSGGKAIHQDSFVDRGTSRGPEHVPVLWELADRAFREGATPPGAAPPRPGGAEKTAISS